MSDAELLQDYVRQRSETAFASIVERHVNLVYSAARRQVSSPHLAEDVAQAVFVELSRHAARIPSAQPLAAWLYVVTRRTAIDAIRREARRLARETTAAELAAMKTPSEGWSKVEDAVDEAMAALNDTERAAVVLRFFQNLSLREVGVELGISEDTAQKRVSRALDRLRTFFTARGVVVTAAGLATDLSTHAIESAPAGLGAGIVSSAALAGAGAAATSAVSRAVDHLLSLATRKTVASAACAAALAVAVYEGMMTVRLRGAIRAGDQNIERLMAVERVARLEAGKARRNLVQFLPNGGLSPASTAVGDAALSAEIAAWLSRTAGLRRALAEHPEKRLPEMKLLSEDEWLNAARRVMASSTEIDATGPHTEIDFEPNLDELRKITRRAFVTTLLEAVKQFQRKTGGELPAGFDQLAPCLPSAFDPEIAARYDFSRENGRVMVAEKSTATGEPERLTYLEFSAHPLQGAHVHFENALERLVREAAGRYAAANGGARPAQPEQLAPFLPRPLQPAQLAEAFETLPFAGRDVSTPAP